MLDAFDIRPPCYGFGISRVCNDEPVFRQAARQLDQHRFQSRLTVVAIVPKIAETPAFADIRHRPIAVKIDGAVQRPRSAEIIPEENGASDGT